jgi:hypothetical protein
MLIFEEAAASLIVTVAAKRDAADPAFCLLLNE